MLLNSDFINWIRSEFKDQVRFNEPMAKHTSFKVGGPADVFVRPESVDALKSLIKKSEEYGVPYTIVGDGTNLLVDDSGIRGIVISLTKMRDDIEVTDHRDNEVLACVPAGKKTQALCRYAVKNGYTGLNLAIGVPGTVGGAIRMNAGTRHGSLDRLIDSITVIDRSGKIKSIKKDQLDFGYRTMKTDLESAIILSGTFRLKKGDPLKLETEADKMLRERKASQPVTLPNAGCFFKNPEKGDPAGKLIELAGLKGTSIGGAMISEKHANFIVNKGNASASDILGLKDLIQDRVSRIFNVDLETEVKIVGSQEKST